MAQSKRPLIVYSNRPPLTASGGAQQVIAAQDIDVWVGPQVVPDAEWDKLSPEERTELTYHGKLNGASYETVTFKVPARWEQLQYEKIANEVLWPVMHSMKPTAKGADGSCQATVEQLDEAYFNGYLPVNELANLAIAKLKSERFGGQNPREWIHDYQCSNVKGEVYASHIPWPDVGTLNQIQIPSEKHQPDGSVVSTTVPILQTAFFRDYVELMSSRKLLSFQRPIDMANFITTLAVVDPDFIQNNKSIELTFPPRKEGQQQFTGQLIPTWEQRLLKDHPDFADRVAHPEKWAEKGYRTPDATEQIVPGFTVENLRNRILRSLEMGENLSVKAFGSPITVMNIPVGVNADRVREAAIQNKDRLNLATFDPEKLFNADIGNGKTANLTNLDSSQFSNKNKPTLEDVVEPIRNRKWVFSVHRNDYTKNTLVKLDAARKFFEENPQALKDTTFLFVLQPTRDKVAGYKDYAQGVFAETQRLQQYFGDMAVQLGMERSVGERAITVIPQGIPSPQLMGLMAQKEMHTILALGEKDGHDLTPREFIHANSLAHPVSVVASSQVGAADVLGDHTDIRSAAGAYVIREPRDSNEVVEAVKQSLAAKDRERAGRYAYMEADSKRYSASHYGDEIMKQADLIDASQSLPKDTFHNRDGKIEPVGKERPHYISRLVEQSLDNGEPPSHVKALNDKYRQENPRSFER